MAPIDKAPHSGLTYLPDEPEDPGIKLLRLVLNNTLPLGFRQKYHISDETAQYMWGIYRKIEEEVNKTK